METEEIITDAQSPDKFDVLAFVESTAYPTERVVVFQDAKSASEYVRLVNERIEVDKAASSNVQDGERDLTQEEADLSARIEALGEKIRKSSIVFELRGMPPGIVQELMKAPEEDTDELSVNRDNELIAKSIISAENADGTADPHRWVAEDVAKLRKFLKEGEFGKLVKAVSDVNFNAAIFDQATDAGFSS